MMEKIVFVTRHPKNDFHFCLKKYIRLKSGKIVTAVKIRPKTALTKSNVYLSQTIIFEKL